MSERQRVGLSAVAMALAGVALLWVPVLWLNLTPALFAALITYGGTRAIAALLTRRWPQLRAVWRIFFWLFFWPVNRRLGCLCFWPPWSLLSLKCSKAGPRCLRRRVWRS